MKAYHVFYKGKNGSVWREVFTVKRNALQFIRQAVKDNCTISQFYVCNEDVNTGEETGFTRLPLPKCCI